MPLLFLFFCAFCVFVQAREPCEKPQNQPPSGWEDYERLCLAGWAVNRTYFAANDSPIAHAMQKHERSVESLRTLLNFVKSEHKRAHDLQTSKRSDFVRFNEEPCNIKGEFAKKRIESVNVSTSRYGWGLMESKCTTGLVTKVNRTVVRAFVEYEQNLNKAKGEATRRESFTEPSTFIKFNYRTDLDTCRLWHYAAFRYRGQWGINTPITNDKVTKSLAEWTRHYFVEVLRLTNDNQIVAIPMTLRTRPEKPYNKSEPFETGWTRNATTHMATWGGMPASSLFESTLFLANNPAIKAAMDDVSGTIDQIEDATTLSGMAILIMPIFLTTIPIAMFADIDTIATLVYTIATDVLTVMPLAIKGIELLRYSGITHEAVRTRVYGGFDIHEPAAMETWYASCDANDRVKILGKLFISIAVIFMIIGIALELVTKKIFEKRRTLYEFNKKSARHNQMWKGAVCTECECAVMGPKLV